MTARPTTHDLSSVRPVVGGDDAYASVTAPDRRSGGDRRGRPYQIADDRSAARDLAVDVDARVGWLLIMSRLHRPDPDLTRGGLFLGALAEAGLQASRSAISRWESGSVSARYSVLTAYERALQIPPGQISCVVSVLRRVHGPKVARGWMPEVDPYSESFALRLDELLDMLVAGQATGSEWVEFGHYVGAPGVLYIHGSVWFEIAMRLIDELARSVGLAHLQRCEAIRVLMDHPVASSWLLQAAREYLLDPAMPLVHGTFDAQTLSSKVQAADYLSMLAVRHEPEAPAGVNPQTATRVAQQLAEEVSDRLPGASLYDRDEMTPRIIREALFSTYRIHRHLARLMLFSSPFRGELAAMLTQRICGAPLDDGVRTAMARLLRYVAGPDQESTLLRAIPNAKQPDALEMTLTLGQIPPSGEALDDLTKLLNNGHDALDQAIVHAAGMRGDESLSSIAVGSGYPSALRDAAVWWLRKGSAIHV